MSIILFDRKGDDRLGNHISIYIAQIVYAHYHKLYVLFYKDINKYWYYENPFVRSIFDWLQEKHNIKYNCRHIETVKIIGNLDDYINFTSNVVMSIKCDTVSYFTTNIFPELFVTIPHIEIPFDPNKTILVHLRLEDVAFRNDYDGTICSEYYRKKIENGEESFIEFYGERNMQSPLSCEKLNTLIKNVLDKHNGFNVIFLTAKNSDVTPYNPNNFQVLQTGDTALDIMYLSCCNVVILSRSIFALSSLFFPYISKEIYAPSWGHFVSCGLNTKYDKTGIQYFY